MQITIVNNSSVAVPAAGAVSVAAGATLNQTERTADEAAGLVDRYAGSTVQVHVTLEALDYPPLLCKIKTPSDPGSGVGTQAANGFDMEDLYGNAYAFIGNMYFAVFDDAACTTKAANATLDTAANGTIVSGAATNTLLITPDASGIVSVTLTDATDETVYMKAWVAESARPIDTSETHTTPFIP